MHGIVCVCVTWRELKEIYSCSHLPFAEPNVFFLENFKPTFWSDFECGAVLVVVEVAVEPLS